jgi:hypothetical protein
MGVYKERCFPRWTLLGEPNGHDIPEVKFLVDWYNGDIEDLYEGGGAFPLKAFSDCFMFKLLLKYFDVFSENEVKPRSDLINAVYGICENARDHFDTMIMDLRLNPGSNQQPHVSNKITCFLENSFLSVKENIELLLSEP